MFRDEFKETYTTIPFAIHREFCAFGKGGVISHQHKEIELIAMTEGMADFYIDGELYRAEKGDVLIIAPYSIHRVETASDKLTSYNCICFDLELLWDRELVTGLTNHTLSVTHLISKELAEAPLISECIENGCVTCEKKQSGWELEAIGNISLIFGTLKSHRYFKPTITGSAKTSFAQKAMDYIVDNYWSGITSAEVANALYMNNSYFCRVFKKTFGCCFSDYILAYRLEKAKAYLVNTNLTVTEVSFKVGFNSCSYFVKAFRERIGLSPLSYRKSKGAVSSGT